MNHLKRNGIAADQQQTYVKWLRYFLDFCSKHLIVQDKMERLRLFTEKLHEKKQGDEQCRQATHAVTLYFEMQPYEPLTQQNRPVVDEPSSVILEPVSSLSSPTPQRPSQFRLAGYQELSDSPEWDEVLVSGSA